MENDKMNNEMDLIDNSGYLGKVCENEIPVIRIEKDGKYYPLFMEFEKGSFNVECVNQDKQEDPASFNLQFKDNYRDTVKNFNLKELITKNVSIQKTNLKNKSDLDVMLENIKKSRNRLVDKTLFMRDQNFPNEERFLRDRLEIIEKVILMFEMLDLKSPESLDWSFIYE